jgi:hypothetical protein
VTPLSFLCINRCIQANPSHQQIRFFFLSQAFQKNNIIFIPLFAFFIINYPQKNRIMTRNYLLVCLSLVLVMASCAKEQGSDQEIQINTPERRSKEDINAFVLSQLHEKNIFKWETMDNEMLWSAMSHGNDIASIGYQPAGFTNIEERIHDIDITKEEWRSVRQDIIDLVVSETQRYFPGENITAAKLL